MMKFVSYLLHDPLHDFSLKIILCSDIDRHSNDFNTELLSNNDHGSGSVS